MVDIHCHIVPGVDDGATDVENSLAMIRQAKQAGVTAILTTPHIRANPTERLVHDIHKEAFSRLSEAHETSDVRDVRLMLGGEVRVTADTLQIVGDKIFTAGEHQKYILLELASQEVPTFFSQVIFEFRLRGITPIVAHPERNLAVLKRPEHALDFVRQGAHLQLTTSSINGELGPTIERAAKAMLRAGIISIIASDAHNLSTRTFLSWQRSEAALSSMSELPAGTFERLGTTNPLAVFDGNEFPQIDVDSEVEATLLNGFADAKPDMGEKRKRFFFF